MPKGNVYALRRTKPKTVTREIDPKDGSGQVFSITLRTPTSMDAFAIGDKFNELSAMYLPNEQGECKVELPPLGDEPVEVRSGALLFVSQLSVLQEGAPEDKYTDVEFILMCASDMGVEALQELLQEAQALSEVQESASPLQCEEGGKLSSDTA